MPAVQTIQDNIFIDGLGHATKLGCGFLRRVTVDFATSVTTHAITAASLGATEILRVISIVPKSVETFYQSALPAGGASVSITASANTGICDVFVLCRGL